MLSEHPYLYCEHEPVNRLDPSGHEWLDATADFFAGLGNTISFGLTDKIRDWIGANDAVDKSSSAYQAGGVAGDIWWFAAGAAGVGRAAGYEVWFLRYKNTGGVGMTVRKGGERIFSVDWHRFKLRGRFVNRIHYHRRPGIKQHRPWQGGW